MENNYNKETIDAETSKTEDVQNGIKSNRENHEKSSHHHDHHSYHYHRYHHKKYQRSHSKNSKQFFEWLRKKRHIIVNIVTCTIAVICLVLLSIDFDTPDNNRSGEVVSNAQSKVIIETAIYPQDIVMVHDAIVDYLDDGNQMSALDVYKSYSGYNKELNICIPFKFEYRIVELPVNVKISQACLILTENNTVKKYKIVPEDESIDIYNLKTGTDYQYDLFLTFSNGCEASYSGSFTTAKTPRILKIDGTVNVRDIGGWSVGDGREIKQGMLYRGSELDGAVQKDYCLSQAGLDEMRDNLGIKFDMDLRSKSDNMSGVDSLGDDIKHVYYGTKMYSEVFQPENKESIRRVFADFANKNNYPIYLHCTYGRDRTGTVCYLLEALLGVLEKDLLREYELSAFTDSYVNSEEFENFTNQINMLEGDTLQHKVENYLLSCGVTADEIESIRNILIG